MMRFLVLLSVGVVIVSAQRTEVSRCVRHSGPLPLLTYIEGCTTPPCRVSEEDTVFNISFISPRAINSLKTEGTVFIKFGSASIPISINWESDVCNSLVLGACPLKAQDGVIASLKIPFGKIPFPVDTEVTVELQMQDENNDAVVCLRVPFTSRA
ncbi:uncharacterized protein LOC142981613 [Anticarsia gemmatalis]|uniref:uncharacterized protein LOC142981613 n=1 Tax=Anticarsia gemmatalis TaxID=129554 RepID=UPI003F76F12A